MNERDIAKLKDEILQTMKNIKGVLNYGMIKHQTPLDYPLDVFKKYTDEIAAYGYLDRIKSDCFKYNSTADFFEGYEIQYEEQVIVNAESERKKQRLEWWKLANERINFVGAYSCDSGHLILL